MFRYAASYFGDSDAQYNLARLYLAGTGAPKDPTQAARWLLLAANKGDHRAQALLGGMLFRGELLTDCDDDRARQEAIDLAAYWAEIDAEDEADPWHGEPDESGYPDW